MAKASSMKKETMILDIKAVEFAEVRFNVLGDQPLIMERFQPKAWRELLFPGAVKNRAERESTMKHNPVAEFRDSVYRCQHPESPTLVHMPVGAFHSALASAALDIPGATKSRIERLTRITNVTVHLYGIPHIFCTMVRNSDMQHTPDVRTRPIFPQWACTVTFRFAKSLLTERAIAHLFAAAGMIIGVGGWRSEKGGPYGSWKTVNHNDAEFNQIVKTQGRAAQIKALEQPVYFDEETEELLTWFEQEVIRRERSLDGGVEHPGGRRRKKKDVPLLPPDIPLYTEDNRGNLISSNGK